jgi:hypothetical protein
MATGDGNSDAVVQLTECSYPTSPGRRAALAGDPPEIPMVRLLVITLTVMTLRFGGVSALHQDGLGAVRGIHTDLNSLSNQVTSDIENLRTTLSSFPNPGS